MKREILFRGKREKGGEWIYGYSLGSTICDCDLYQIATFDNDLLSINPETVGQYTGLIDKNGNKIFEGDITRLVLPDGEIRCFEVAIRTVTREVVSHPDFDDPTAKVVITGVVFLWEGYELFPCVNDDGIADTARMEVIDNIYDISEYGAG